MELEELWSSVIPQCNQSFCTLTPLSDQSTSKELLYDSLREQQQKTEPFSLILRVGMDSALCGRLAHLSTLMGLIDYLCTERKVVPVCQTTKTEVRTDHHRRQEVEYQQDNSTTALQFLWGLVVAYFVDEQVYA